MTYWITRPPPLILYSYRAPTWKFSFLLSFRFDISRQDLRHVKEQAAVIACLLYWMCPLFDLPNLTRTLPIPYLENLTNPILFLKKVRLIPIVLILYVRVVMNLNLINNAAAVHTNRYLIYGFKKGLIICYFLGCAWWLRPIYQHY